MALRGNINLSDLKGNLSSRGRSRYENPELAEMLTQLVNGEIQHVVWDDLFTVNAKTTEKEITNQHAKWRNRASSVFASLNTDKVLTISWTDAHEMVIQIVKES